jgi:nucleoside-diphosphate-sugar epimerase
MKKVLITGSLGFIGQHLLNSLKETNYKTYECNRINGDLTLENTWIDIEKCDYVIHLAGKSSIPDSWTDIHGFINNNTNITVNVLNYCRQHNSKLIILSTYLYGNPLKLPIDEFSEIFTINPYAFSKKVSEDLCKFYSENFGVRITILRPFNVYGVGQSNKFLIPSLITQILNGSTISIKDLEPKRDYVYISDLIDSIIKCLSLDNKFEIFNIGSGESYSVKEIIDIIQDKCNTNYPINTSNERRQNEVMNTIADISKAHKFLNWTPKKSIHEGIDLILNSNRELDAK